MERLSPALRSQICCGTQKLIYYMFCVGVSLHDENVLKVSETILHNLHETVCVLHHHYGHVSFSVVPSLTSGLPAILYLQQLISTKVNSAYHYRIKDQWKRVGALAWLNCSTCITCDFSLLSRSPKKFSEFNTHI